MRCGEKVTNWHYFIQSSFTPHSLHFELFRISLSVSLDSLLYYLLSHQSSITLHVRGSTHLLLFHDALFIIRKASPEGRRRLTIQYNTIQILLSTSHGGFSETNISST